jgi:hypothetical protein
MTWRAMLRRPTFMIPLGIVLRVGAVWLATTI